MTTNLLAGPDTQPSGVTFWLPRWHNWVMPDAVHNELANLEVRTPSGTDDPLSDQEIQKYREEINRMDQIILEAIKHRTAVSQAIGRTRMGSGGTRLVHTREIAILNQFRDDLGEEGPAIASALLRMGRGRLG